MPPQNSDFERYLDPNILPILTPIAEQTKVTQPIKLTAGTICTFKNAKVT